MSCWQKICLLKKNNKEPKILIIHSHPQESYSIDEKGTKGSVNDVGDELEKILEANYILLK